jgi:hypothetical protein
LLHAFHTTIASRGTAAIPPLAAAASLAVGLGVLKRVVEHHHQDDGSQPDDTVPALVLTDAENAAAMALRATHAAGNALSQNQLMERFGLTRAAATKVRSAVLSSTNGHAKVTAGSD